MPVTVRSLRASPAGRRVRRNLLRGAALGLCAGAAVLPTSRGLPAQAGPTGDRPNILLIVTDDQPFGTTKVMPRLRQWFKDGGVRFSNAFASTPLCCPSRSSILTGQYAHNHGVQRNGAAENFPVERSVEANLQDAGYRTAIAGKYLNKIISDPPRWNRWATQIYGYVNAEFNLDGNRKTVPTYSTDFIRSKALEFLYASENDDEQPWFLYVAPYAPHSPARPADRHRRLSVPKLGTDPAKDETDLSDKPPFVHEFSYPREQLHQLWRRQMRSLMAVDDMIGQIFEAMGSLEERNNTIAIFISDNGFVYGDHNVFRKRVPYTNSIHVPLFLWAPGLVQAGSVDRNLVLNLDIGTTIFDLAGIDPAHELDGTSLLDPRVRDHVLGEAIYDQQEEPRVPGWSSYRSRDIQYIEYYAEDGSVNFREYYDLQKDPYQLRNLLGDDNPDNDPDVTQLHDTLEADRTCAGASCP